MKRSTIHVALFACVVIGSAAEVGAASIETAVLTAGGYSNWGTYGVPAPFSDYFSDSVSVPTIGLAAAGVPGEIKSQSATSGFLTDQSSINTGFSGNTFVGSTQVRAEFGVLGAEAHGVFTGNQSSSIVAATQGMAVFKDSFNITSPTIANGTPGLVSFQFTIDGSTTSTAGAPGNGSSGRVLVNYRQNNDPTYLLMRATSDPRFAPDLYPYDTTTGWTKTSEVGTSSVFGSSVFSTFGLPFVYGTPFDFTTAMLAYAWPGVGSSDVDFYSSVVLTGISGVAADSLITGASGTHYSLSGVVPQPIPGDGNGDGWVDGLDYLLWAGAFGTHPGPDGDISDGDYNDDGSVDGLDYLQWAGHYGTHATTDVPEPSSLALLLGCLTAASVRRR
ncbi:MAG: PEP-CTERM sorting domain-containing protein [Pirellulales bacterium]|nr:PEP-CTERM sorting domain-containing protein [Planctomycetales bacterium]